MLSLQIKSFYATSMEGLLNSILKITKIKMNLEMVSKFVNNFKGGLCNDHYGI